MSQIGGNEKDKQKKHSKNMTVPNSVFRLRRALQTDSETMSDDLFANMLKTEDIDEDLFASPSNDSPSKKNAAKDMFKTLQNMKDPVSELLRT
jgi:hypothetical protein